jgi:hypothetical protein
MGTVRLAAWAAQAMTTQRISARQFRSTSLRASLDPASFAMRICRFRVFLNGMRSLSGMALAALLTVLPAVSQQQPQFAQGFGGAGPAPARSPAESAAYTAAIGQPSPDLRVSAIQQFLINYPASSLRQSAITQMMIAKHQTSSAGARPPGMMMNRGMPDPPAPAGPPSTPGPAPVSPPAAPEAQISAAPRESLLQQAAKPAEVTIAQHNLAIKADNSSLSEILHTISASTGMKLEGFSQDQRIFGSYGPGDAHEVLLALLEGSGYNVMMVGQTATGVPIELTLTQRGAAMGQASTPGAKPNGEEEDDADDIQQAQQPEPAQPQPIPVNQPNPESPPRFPADAQQDMIRARQQQLQQQQQQLQQNQPQ